MSRLIVVVGDATSGGGQVISGSPFTDIDGYPVARVGDKATCSACGGVFPIASGDPTFSLDGPPVARHGDRLSCGHTLIAGRQFRGFLDSQTSDAPGVGTAGQAAAPSGEPEGAGTRFDEAFDEAFVLKSALTGKPLAHRRYRIVRDDASIVEGVTDSEGVTALARSNAPELLHVEIQEERAHA